MHPHPRLRLRLAGRLLFEVLVVFDHPPYNLDMANQDPHWLIWARRLQGIAQTGQAYAGNPFDQARYQEISALAVQMVHHHTEAPSQHIAHLLGQDTGYATPKVDVRAAVFDAQHRLLLVREVSDQHRWTLPGGWADVNITAADNAVKEVLEESGYHVAVTKLAAVWDHARQGHTSSLFSCYKIFFICELLGGEAATSAETSGSGWFAESEIPPDLSRARVLPHQISLMFEHHRSRDLAPAFE